MLRKQLRPAIVHDARALRHHRVIYPGVVTGLAQLLFPRQANGSLVDVNGRVVGSALIGQSFTQPDYFHSRPSAAGAGTTPPRRRARTRARPTEARRHADRAARSTAAIAQRRRDEGAIPTDMVTASASGLDPHISPANARAAGRARGRARAAPTRAAVRALVDRHTEGRQFGFFGEPRVNVLLLNIALDSAFASHARRRSPVRIRLMPVLARPVRRRSSMDRRRCCASRGRPSAPDPPPKPHRHFAASSMATTRSTSTGRVDFDRAFTTQPARHNEFNVNLAYVDAKLDAPRAARAVRAAGRHVGPVELCGRAAQRRRQRARSLARYIQEASSASSRRQRLGRWRHLLLAHRHRGLDLARQPDVHALARRRLLAVLRERRQARPGRRRRR